VLAREAVARYHTACYFNPPSAESTDADVAVIWTTAFCHGGIGYRPIIAGVRRNLRGMVEQS
jgi:hypothetical protein